MTSKRGVLARLFVGHALACLICLGHTADTSAASIPEAVRSNAEELIQRLNNHPDLAGIHRPKTVLWPMAETQVQKALAESIHDRFSRSFDELANRNFAVLSDAGLRQLRFALGNVSENPVSVLRDADPPIDIVIVGDVRRVGGEVSLTHQAIKVATGLQLARVGQDGVELGQGEQFCGAGSQPVASLMRRAAREFRSQFSDMNTLHMCGIHDGESGAASKAGEWLDGKLREAVTTEHNDIITERRISIETGGLHCGAWLLGQPASNFYISGRYFAVGDALDLMLTLRDPKGGEHNFNGCLANASLPNAFPQRSGPFIPQGLRENVIGPIDFRIGGERGQNPRYQFGETLEFTLELDQDAYVHCFYRDAEGTTVKIFPNPEFSQSKLGAGLVSIPGPQMPFELVVTPPEGSEFLKCFASIEDVSDRLPSEIAESELEPLPRRFGEYLAVSFRNASPEGLSEASLVINVLSEASTLD